MRAAPPLHPREHRKYSKIDGVSAATLREVHRWESGRPGAVEDALAWWRREAAELASRRWHGVPSDPHHQDRCPCVCCEFEPPGGRDVLGEVLRALSRRGRRELTAVVARIDGPVLAATHGPGPGSPEWWTRRC